MLLGEWLMICVAIAVALPILGMAVMIGIGIFNDSHHRSSGSRKARPKRKPKVAGASLAHLVHHSKKITR